MLSPYGIDSIHYYSKIIQIENIIHIKIQIIYIMLFANDLN